MVLASSAASATFGFLVAYFWLPDVAVALVLGILFTSVPIFRIAHQAGPALAPIQSGATRRHRPGLPGLACRTFVERGH